MKDQKTKDSLFCHLFTKPKYQKQLLAALELADGNIREDSIRTVRLNAMNTDTAPNSIVLKVDNQCIMVAEERHPWSYNSLVRLWIYYGMAAAEVLQSYPRLKPYFFVFYSGPQSEQVPTGVVSLDKLLYSGENCDVKMTVTVLSTPEGDGIAAQYLRFCEELNVSMSSGKGAPAEEARRVIQNCVGRDILRDYFLEHADEAETIVTAMLEEACSAGEQGK